MLMMIFEHFDERIKIGVERLGLRDEKSAYFGFRMFTLLGLLAHILISNC
jgi:hypothetical protein